VREQQAVAFKAINGITVPISPMSLYAAAVVAGEPWAVEVTDVCARADVELLRYPVPVERQRPGQTMAVGAIARCLRGYGAATLITALQCITQTTNNKPGALTARMIRALCEVLSRRPDWRDSGLVLLDVFDRIDLLAVQREAAVGLASKDPGMPRKSQLVGLTEKIYAELSHAMPSSKAEALSRFTSPVTPTAYASPHVNR
jgi:hypothetical protein